MDYTSKASGRISLGLLYVLISFFIWGFAPLFWKQIQGVGPYELLVHRIFWGHLLCILAVKTTRFREIFTLLNTNRKLQAQFFLTSSLVCSNWFIFVYAINSGYIVDASLGYFLNPIINIFLGLFLLKEKATPLQYVSFALTAFAVAYLFANNAGRLDISLSLALTFSLYGLLRKKMNFNAFEGLYVETLFWMPFATALLVYWHFDSSLDALHTDPISQIFVVLTGLMTLSPLYFFTKGVPLIEYKTTGIVQYLAPTFQFFIGVFVYNELMSSEKWTAFVLIWLAIGLYLVSFLRPIQRS